MAQKEKDICNELALACSKWERLFRSNAGMAWAGQIVGKGKDWIKIKNPRPFHGLPEGFSDMFGISSVVVTPDMVGQRIAVFRAVEVKTGSVPVTEKQKLFGEMVKKLGGIFEIVRG